MSIESVMPPNHFILCRPHLLPLSIFPSIKVLLNEWVLYIRWPKYWSFNFSIIPSNEYSGLIFIRCSSWIKKRQRNQRSDCQHPLEHWKAEFQKNICFLDYTKAFDCVDHKKLWNILQEMGIPDRLTCLLRNLYAGQGATVRTRHGTTDWFQIGKGVHSKLIRQELEVVWPNLLW